MSIQHVFSLTLVGLSVIYYLSLDRNVRWGHAWYSAYCVQVISPITLGMLALTFEHRSAAAVTDIHSLPLSLVIGDPIFVALAIWTTAKAHRKFDITLSLRWRAGWIVIGLAVAVAFNAWDGGNFVAAGREAALLSPTKLAHDYATMPVLVTVSFGHGLPVLKHAGWYRWVLVACFAGWALLVVFDTQRGLDLTKLHPLWDAVRFAPM